MIINISLHKTNTRHMLIIALDADALCPVCRSSKQTIEYSRRDYGIQTTTHTLSVFMETGWSP